MKLNKILVVRNDRLGEFLLTIPALRALKETFGCHLAACVDPSLLELAEINPYINEVIVWENRKHSWKELLRFIFEIRSRHFDACVIFNPRREFNVASYFSGIPTRIGYDHKWDFLLTQTIRDIRDLGLRHEVDINLDMVRLLNAGTQDKTLGVEVSQAESKGIDQFFIDHFLNEKKVIAIHPFASEEGKRWPMENFVNLIEHIKQEEDLRILLIGKSGESRRELSLERCVDRNRVLDLRGRTNLQELAALLVRSTLLISNDSGPVHLASAVGTPSVVLFQTKDASKSPRRWRPWDEQSLVIARQSIERIPVEEVLEGVHQLLEAGISLIKT